MVSIISSYTVLPSEPTPKCTLWLSESDQINAWTHAPSIYIYRPQHNHHANVETLRISLSKILVHYYPLAGRIRRIQGGRMEADCNEMGVELFEAQSTKPLDDYGDFVPDDTIRALIPKVDYSKPIEEVPLLLVQFTRFSCGGLCVGIALSHMLVDGVSAIHFVNSWAKLARGDTLRKDEMPFLDRTVLKSREPLEPPHFEHPEFKPLPFILGCSDNMDERKKETTAALLKLTKEEVEKLKKKANDETVLVVNQNQQWRPFSRYEALAGHIWRCVSKARQHDKNQATVVRIVCDVRNRLKPTLPPNYFGNAVLRSVTPTCLSGDLTSKPLSYAAKKMREAVEVLTDEYLRSELDFVTSQQDVDWLRASFHTLGCVKAQFLGNPNLTIGSWMSMPVYAADFGWGSPVYMGPGALNTDGKIFIIPGPTGDGSVIVAIRLQTARMEAFKKFFYDDIGIEK